MNRKKIIITLFQFYASIYSYQETVQINEYMVNPQYEANLGESYSSNEYIELYNSSAFPISLEGWFIKVDSEVEMISLLDLPFCPRSNNLILPPFSYAIIFPGGYMGYYQQDITNNSWGSKPLYLTTKNSRLGRYGLNNEQGEISLLNKEQQIISKVNWNQPFPFNQSKEKINCDGNNEPYNWRISPANSPGYANSSYSANTQLVDSVFSINRPICITQNRNYNNWYATIKLQDNQTADLELFNLQGQKMQSILHNFQYTGTTTVSWIRNSNQIVSGMHLLKLTIRDTQSNKIIYQKIKKVVIVTLK